MKFIYRFTLLGILLCAAAIGGVLPTRKDSCDKPVSMADMYVCNANEYKKADSELSNIYEKLMVKLSDAYLPISDKSYVDEYKKLLKTSEDIWEKFRDADCAFSNYDRIDGSSYGIDVVSCKTDLTNMRIKELKEMYKSL